MVILDQMPDVGTIRAFRGTVDFYRRGDQAIARAWPRKRRSPLTQGEVNQQRRLQDAMAIYNSISPRQKVQHFLSAYHGNFTSRDVFMKHYFGTFAFPDESKEPFVDPRSPIPYPDPEGTYWAVIWHQYRINADSKWELIFKVSSPGTYQLRYTTRLPNGGIHMYRRRGETLRGSSFFTRSTADSGLIATTDADNILHFKTAPIGFFNDERQHFTFYIIKEIGAGFARGFSPMYRWFYFGERTFGSPPGSSALPGDLTFFPITTDHDGRHRVQIISADPFHVVQYPPPYGVSIFQY